MELRLRTKKIIVISSSLILVIALFVWYFFPVLMANWFRYQSDILRQYLGVTPVEITALKAPPNEWTRISIGDLTIRLPMFEYTKVGGKESYIYFISGKGFLMVDDIVPSKELMRIIKEKRLKYPVLSYRDELAIFSSTSNDISFFNSRSKNETASRNQILKAIAIPEGSLSKVLSVNTGVLKALCIMSEKRDKGYHAIAYVYSQNEKVSLTLMLRN